LGFGFSYVFISSKKKLLGYIRSTAVRLDRVLNIIGILLVILELKFCAFVYVLNLSV